jgi:Farnesoic acid 0-methyl transferase
MMRPALAAGMAAALVGAAGGCKSKPESTPEPPAITADWSDDFERPDLGNDWHATSDSYQLVNGALSARGAKNRPLWLRRKLPRDVVIELDVWSNTPDGDIKVELFGDGRSFDRDAGRYTSSGYVVVMGGWNNSKSIVARGDEHGKDVVERAQPKVDPGRRYHWKIVRRGGRVEWFVNDMTAPFLALTDPTPLDGQGHAYFAINNWQSDSWFDNLRIAPFEAETAPPQ